VNEDLIKRIDEWLNDELPDDLVELLQNYRVGLLARSAENKSLRNQNTALDEKLAEISEKKYVPMTDAEWETVNHAMYYVVSSSYRRLIETAVIRRAGLEVQE